MTGLILFLFRKGKIIFILAIFHMFKFLTLAIVCFSLYLLSLFISFQSLFQDYRSLSYPNQQQNGDEAILEDDKYKKLKIITRFPFIGSFYSECLIKQMVRRKQWPQVIEESEIALLSIANRNSYKIWYYRGVAECASLKFQSCQQSLYEAEFLAPEFFMQKIYKLKNVFNHRYRSMLQVRREQLWNI